MKTPVVIFLFKRIDTLERIFEVIRRAKPEKVYLLADGPRNDNEKIKTDAVRKKAKSLIDWDCEIIAHFHAHNVGVYKNIGMGAYQVLTEEKQAIFLEDDSLPELTFFQFCEELLERYEKSENILWICGTNYIQKYPLESDQSYYFTRNLLPCGWASWADKFKKYYDGNLEGLSKVGLARMKSTYIDKKLFKQELNSIRQTEYLLKNEINMASWDRQMSYSVRSNNLYGVSPAVNQIKNIGVDALSTHGGNSLNKIMTKRFCELNTHPIQFPLSHPAEISIKKEFESQTENIILYPFGVRVKILLGSLIKKLLFIPSERSFTQVFNKIRQKNRNN